MRAAKPLAPRLSEQTINIVSSPAMVPMASSQSWPSSAAATVVTFDPHPRIVLGNKVEQNKNTKTQWSVGIKMDGGQQRTFIYSSQPAVHEGDRVKLVDGGKRLALVAPVLQYVPEGDPDRQNAGAISVPGIPLRIDEYNSGSRPPRR